MQSVRLPLNIVTKLHFNSARQIFYFFYFAVKLVEEAFKSCRVVACHNACRKPCEKYYISWKKPCLHLKVFSAFVLPFLTEIVEILKS